MPHHALTSLSIFSLFRGAFSGSMTCINNVCHENPSQAVTMDLAGRVYHGNEFIGQSKPTSMPKLTREENNTEVLLQRVLLTYDARVIGGAALVFFMLLLFLMHNKNRQLHLSRAKTTRTRQPSYDSRLISQYENWLCQECHGADIAVKLNKDKTALIIRLKTNSEGHKDSLGKLLEPFYPVLKEGRDNFTREYDQIHNFVISGENLTKIYKVISAFSSLKNDTQLSP